MNYQRLMGLLVAALPPAALAADTLVARCREQSEATARLACYDAIPIAPRPAVHAASSPQVLAEFGRRTAAAAVAAIVSSVPDDFEGWRANGPIRLDNGQVWQVTDDSAVSMDRRRRKVTVRRGAMGTYFLDFEDSNHSPRVKRID